MTADAPPPEIVLGLDLRPEALPPGLDGVAARLWAEGEFRAALALLYRGALAHLVHRCRAPISRGATEEECLRAARACLPAAAADYFGRLTRAWLVTAYAGLPPASEDASLCEAWRAHFQDAPREARR